MKTADQVRNIATAAEEQSATSEEIAHSLEDINGLAGETTTLMGHSAGAVKEFSTQVSLLEKLMRDLRETK